MKEIKYRNSIRFVLIFITAFLLSPTLWAQAFRIPEKKPAPKPPVKQQQQDTVKKAADTTTPTVSYTPKNEKIRNLKVISEQSDGRGNIVRVIQYNKGMFRITETIIKPQKLNVNSYFIKVNPDTMDKKQVLLVVDKAKYTLEVIYKKRPIRMYRATFGPKPKQNKCMEGDRCTPEGTFTITNLNPRSPYNKFMLLSYPDAKDWERFNALKKEGKIPSSAKIGGSVGIHGIWKGGDELIDLGVGWTDGCVALKNKDVDELFTLVGIGTKVFIKH